MSESSLRAESWKNLLWVKTISALIFNTISPNTIGKPDPDDVFPLARLIILERMYIFGHHKLNSRTIQLNLESDNVS